MIENQKIYENFEILEGLLYRKQRKGLKPCQTLNNSFRLGKDYAVVRFEYELVRQDKIAWAIHYGTWPSCQLIVADGDIFNMSADNLLPILRTRYKFMPKTCVGGFKHALSKLVFATVEACWKHWTSTTHELYRVDKSYVLRVERENAALRGIDITPQEEIKQLETVKHTKRKTKRPVDVPGRVWGWYKGAWHDLPLATCIADDIQVRAALHI